MLYSPTRVVADRDAAAARRITDSVDGDLFPPGRRRPSHHDNHDDGQHEGVGMVVKVAVRRISTRRL